MWKRFAAAMVLASAPVSGQPHAATLTLVRRATGPLAFSNPVLKMSGTIRPIPGHRLDLVVITVGDLPIEGEMRQFTLISSGGQAYEPIAAGGGADLIFPVDSLPLGREIGQILPSDAQVLMKRISASHVMLEADPGAPLAFVFQVPARSATRGFRLPNGSELALTR